MEVNHPRANFHQQVHTFYVTEIDLFCMRMVWTPKSHAMHHIRRGWRVRKAKKAQKVCSVLM